MMREELAPRILPAVLHNITTEYPYHDAHLTREGEAPHDPIAAHPAFGNGFDWHSSVHSHWTALQLIASGADSAGALDAAVRQNLQPEKLATELAYFEGHRSYERPYGWAWAMVLATVAPSMRAIAQWIAGEAASWLAIVPLPVRHGVHSNTAYALSLMHDAAVNLDFGELRATIDSRARAWFAHDRNWPQEYERSGHDFLSPGLAEADLLRRVLEPDEFATWWRNFLPDVDEGAPILTPAGVPNVEDGHIVHLHGLNLSRASALASIGRELEEPALLAAARRLYEASAERASAGHYSETHWLPTFAWHAAAAIDANT